ncbi:hypothetical protein F4604DRAFT_1498319, partial [Suillus subluteus]
VTTHKAQGQTMDNAVIDLSGASRTESPYVMVLRVKSLQGLLILRPFDKSKIMCRQSEDARCEENRLQVL